MAEYVLQAKPRQVVGKQVHALRRAGQVPAVIYGRHLEPMIISLDFRESTRVLPGVSSSQLVSVNVEGKPHMTLVREKQVHPVTGALLHVDFQEVSMTEKLRVTVGIIFKGESPAVKTYNGVIVTSQEELEVECLPQDLVSHIDVDLSVLKEIGDTIHVRDIVLSSAIEVLTDLDEIVVLVTPPLAEEVAPEVEAAVAEPEVIERGKKEEGEEF